MKDWWSTTYLEVVADRRPGALVHYRCIGDNMLEGQPDGELTKSGVVECLEGDPIQGGSPRWNYTLTLPCKPNCPLGFVLNNDSTTCFSFSDSPTEFGLAGAAQKCGQVGASLAVLREPSDLAFALQGNFYYTAHTRRGNTTVIPKLPDTITCNTDCDVRDEAECVTVGKNILFRAQDCEDPTTHYMCMVPQWCPEDYRRHKGFCYRLVNHVNNFTEALALCENDGAALTYPETLDALMFLTNMIMEEVIDVNTNQKTAMIGLNDATGEWTRGGLYAPDAEVLQIADTSPPDTHWRLLTVDVSTSSYNLTPATLAGGGATWAICQLHGPLGECLSVKLTP
ncbi:uncharacterized protein LOC121856820 [Homarus americanus]|uniref:uncharacterized protein LOC121856820 n=1 Tax=Homarus americanus TaxID=6706 RepID=UPI001C471CFE|nr:uncharacterized protein LOC121856820 [Homarus americanus]